MENEYEALLWKYLWLLYDKYREVEQECYINHETEEGKKWFFASRVVRAIIDDVSSERVLREAVTILSEKM